MRANRPQYINKPPSFPLFIYKTSPQALRELVAWANTEYNDWLKYLTKNGYYKQLDYFNKNVSPYRILAEMSGFRRIASLISQKIWNELSGRERVFIRRSYELRDALLRQNSA